MPSLSQVRTELKARFKSDLHSNPQCKLTTQVMDLQLLKYNMKKRGILDEHMSCILDSCIEGWIWFYENGGTPSKIPDVIKQNPEAFFYWETFQRNWSFLQQFMQSNMSLMEG